MAMARRVEDLPHRFIAAISRYYLGRPCDFDSWVSVESSVDQDDLDYETRLRLIRGSAVNIDEYLNEGAPRPRQPQSNENPREEPVTNSMDKCRKVGPRNRQTPESIRYEERRHVIRDPLQICGFGPLTDG